MPERPQRFRSTRSSSVASLLLLGTVALWGATFVLVKNALADISPLLFNFLRMALATIVLAAANWKQLRAITLTEVKGGALAGLFLAVGYEFQTLGLARTSATRSAFLTGLLVIFVPALTLSKRLRPVGTTRPGLAAIAGALLAFAGVVLLTTPPGTHFNAFFAGIGLGDLLTLACALAFAAHLLTLAHVSAGMSAGVLASVQIAACSVLMFFALPLEAAHVLATPRLLITLTVCSVFATAAAFTVQSFAQQHLPPTQTVLILSLEPVFAWLTSLLLLGTGLGSSRGNEPGQASDHRSILGACLILAGMLAVELLPQLRSVRSLRKIAS